MDAETVVRAVEPLPAHGQRISVRAVHELCGGSHRDILKHLQA
jgi:hypothetical protein